MTNDTTLARALMDALRETRARHTRKSAQSRRRRLAIERHHVAETAAGPPSRAASA